MVFEGIVGLGLALLLAPAIAEFAKIRNRADRGFSWIAVSGVFFLFAATFSISAIQTGGYLEVLSSGKTLFEILGWIFALIGTIFVGYEMLLEK